MAIDLSIAGIATALAAGAISFLSPCVLPLVPGYISYVVGHGIADVDSSRVVSRNRVQALIRSGSFVLGFSTVFVMLGAGMGLLGSLLGAYRAEINIMSGLLVILFGIMMTGLLRPAWLQRDTRLHVATAGGRPAAGYIMGMAFAFGWSPCIGPVLGAILGIAASSSRASSGVVLLTLYSLGLGIPFLLTAFFFDSLSRRAAKLRHVGRLLQPLAGLTMIAMGVAMVTGHLSDMAVWFLEMFPGLASIG